MTSQSNSRMFFIGLLSSVAMATAIPAFSQGNPPPATAGQPQAQVAAREMRASQLIGKPVKNAQGENLGKIEDLVIDLDSERVYYALLSFGGILGMGNKRFLIPVSAFRPGREPDQPVLDVDKERLKNAPGFDPGRLPDYGASNWHRGVDRYYKLDSAQQAPSGAHMAGATQLLGSKVNDHAQHRVGKISDVVVNFGTGRAYPVLERDSDGKLVALPFSALTLPNRPDLPAMLNVDNPKIETANGFDKSRWPDLNSPNYLQELTNQLLSFQTQAKPNPAAARTGRETTGSGSSK
jgi:sporulation protein YlmC with PRC-barrel domain